jgi:hypothetical protein
MPDIGVELITNKGAVDELSTRKRREGWRNTVSSSQSERRMLNWVMDSQTT